MRALLRRLSVRSVTLILLETLLIVSAVAAASYARLRNETLGSC
jgi:hypothetical protein